MAFSFVVALNVTCIVPEVNTWFCAGAVIETVGGVVSCGGVICCAGPVTWVTKSPFSVWVMPENKFV